LEWIRSKNYVFEKEKKVLLDHNEKTPAADASGRKKITLTKRETSEIRQSDSTGRTRTVQVEVRKKRVLVKQEDEASAPTVSEAVITPVETPKPILDEKELANVKLKPIARQSFWPAKKQSCTQQMKLVN